MSFPNYWQEPRHWRLTSLVWPWRCVAADGDGVTDVDRKFELAKLPGADELRIGKGAIVFWRGVSDTPRQLLV